MTNKKMMGWLLECWWCSTWFVCSKQWLLMMLRVAACSHNACVMLWTLFNCLKITLLEVLGLICDLMTLSKTSLTSLRHLCFTVHVLLICMQIECLRWWCILRSCKRYCSRNDDALLEKIDFALAMSSVTYLCNLTRQQLPTWTQRLDEMWNS